MNSQYEHSFCEVSGTPFEQGVQMGRELKEGIQRNLARVYEKMEREHVDEKAYREFVNKNIRFFEKNRHDMYEELQGIAEGSGIPPISWPTSLPASPRSAACCVCAPRQRPTAAPT